MKVMKNNHGFTLIEMMIVLLVISVLLIITIPNVTMHNSNINNKGCEAYVKMVQAQVQSYEIANGNLPSSIDVLIDEYIPSSACPNGDELTISAEGVVSSVKKD